VPVVVLGFIVIKRNEKEIHFGESDKLIIKRTKTKSMDISVQEKREKIFAIDQQMDALSFKLMNAAAVDKSLPKEATQTI